MEDLRETVCVLKEDHDALTAQLTEANRVIGETRARLLQLPRSSDATMHAYRLRCCVEALDLFLVPYCHQYTDQKGR